MIAGGVVDDLDGVALGAGVGDHVPGAVAAGEGEDEVGLGGVEHAPVAFDAGAVVDGAVLPGPVGGEGEAGDAAPAGVAAGEGIGAPGGAVDDLGGLEVVEGLVDQFLVGVLSAAADEDSGHVGCTSLLVKWREGGLTGVCKG